MYNLFANIIMVLHTTLIISVFVGLTLSFKYKKLRPFEAIFLLSAIVIWSIYGGCPLTMLENYLRNLSGDNILLTEVGFIPYYINTWFSYNMSGETVKYTTYLIATIFLVLSLDWEWPLIKKLKRRWTR